MSGPVTIHVTQDEGELVLDALTVMVEATERDARGKAWMALYQKIGPQVISPDWAESASGADTLERAAMEAVESWTHIRCDSRNDAPWRQVRDWQGVDAVMAALMALVEDKIRMETFAEDNAE